MGHGLCLGFDTFQKAKSGARRLGEGSRVYRNFNQTNKKGQLLGDWWTADRHWLWDGVRFSKLLDSSPVVGLSFSETSTERERSLIAAIDAVKCDTDLNALVDDWQTLNDPINEPWNKETPE